MSAPHPSLLVDLETVLQPLSGCEVVLHPAEPKRDGLVYYSATVTAWDEQSTKVTSTDLGALFAKVIAWANETHPPHDEELTDDFNAAYERPREAHEWQQLKR